jgi:CRP-like cAMP-binding protein
MIPNTFEIKDFRFLKDLSESQMESIFSISNFQEFAVKENLFEEYGALDTLFILLEGTVILGMKVPKGKISIGSIHPGSILAWSALFPPALSSASATAHTPVKALAIPAAKLLRIFEEDPTFGYVFMRMIGKTVSERLTDTRLQLVNVLSI